MEITRDIKKAIEQDAYRYYEQHSGQALARREDGSFRSQGHNDALDAFRHAYTSGRVTQLAMGQQWVARRFGDDAEIGPAHPNDPAEHRMDLWNNEAGRRLGDETSGKDELARKVFQAMEQGQLVTSIGDARLRSVYPDDARLALPAGHPQRELVDARDVDRMNADIVRLQRQAGQRFPDDHADNRYFDALRQQLPATVSDAKVAEALVAGKQAGIQSHEQLDRALLLGERIVVSGVTPGVRAVVEVNAAAPDIQQSVYQADQHNALHAYEQGRQEASVNYGGR